MGSHLEPLEPLGAGGREEEKAPEFLRVGRLVGGGHPSDRFSVVMASEWRGGDV